MERAIQIGREEKEQRQSKAREQQNQNGKSKQGIREGVMLLPVRWTRRWFVCFSACPNSKVGEITTYALRTVRRSIRFSYFSPRMMRWT